MDDPRLSDLDLTVPDVSELLPFILETAQSREDALIKFGFQCFEKGYHLACLRIRNHIEKTIQEKRKGKV